jgi:hypothetical protein
MSHSAPEQKDSAGDQSEEPAGGNPKIIKESREKIGKNK